MLMAMMLVMCINAACCSLSRKRHSRRMRRVTKLVFCSECLAVSSYANANEPSLMKSSYQQTFSTAYIAPIADAV